MTHPATATTSKRSRVFVGWVRSLPGPTHLWSALLVLSAVVWVIHAVVRHASSWHFFHLGVELLVGVGPEGSGQGLHLYRDHPELQFGPLSIISSAPFAAFGETAGGVIVSLVLSALGLVTFAVLIETLDRVLPGAVRVQSFGVLLVAGGAFVITWGDLAVRTAHLDDAIVWAAMAVALRCCVAGQGLGVAWALAVAAAAKPWAIMFAPLVLALPGQRPARGFLLICGFVAATWAPFVLAEPGTLSASQFDLAIDATSGLNLLGLDADTVPSWVRPTQIIGGMALVALVVMSGRWHGAVLAAVAWRLLLDPGARRYYVVGFVFGALAVELLRRPGRLPWLTVAGAAVLLVTSMPDLPSIPGSAARAACCVAAIGVALGNRDTGLNRR